MNPSFNSANFFLVMPLLLTHICVKPTTVAEFATESKKGERHVHPPNIRIVLRKIYLASSLFQIGIYGSGAPAPERSFQTSFQIFANRKSSASPFFAANYHAPRRQKFLDLHSFYRLPMYLYSTDQHRSLLQHRERRKAAKSQWNQKFHGSPKQSKPTA